MEPLSRSVVASADTLKEILQKRCAYRQTINEVEGQIIALLETVTEKHENNDALFALFEQLHLIFGIDNYYYQTLKNAEATLREITALLPITGDTNAH